MNEKDVLLNEEINLQQVRSKVFYGLIILIELADAFYERGCSLSMLSEKCGVSLSNLHPVVHQLETVGVIARHTEKKDWIYLMEEPNDFWILKILPILKTSLKETS